MNIRTYHILRLLATQFDVTALCFYRARERSAEAAVQESVSALRQFAAVEAFPIPQEQSRIRFIADHVRSAVFCRAYTEFTYASAGYVAGLRDVLRAGHFDLVHMDSMDLIAYLPMLGKLPVVCVHHNIESVLLQRMADASQWWKRSYIEMQSRFVQQQERRYCPEMGLNVTVSEADREILLRLAPAARVIVVPNGVATDTFRPGSSSAGGVVCVGGINGLANRDGLEHLCRDILPLLSSGDDRPIVRWVGRATEGEREHYRRVYGVELTGYVNDVRPFVAEAACYVVPLRVGGGTRVKILDAWAMGKAVVSTSIGCEGLAAVDGENILIRDTPEKFALAVREVIRDADLRRHLERNARGTVERLYSWNGIGEPMLAAYIALLRQSPADVRWRSQPAPSVVA